MALTAVPDWVTVAFQELAIVWEPGQVQVTVQPAVAEVPVLVTVTVAWKPVGQLLSTWKAAEQALAVPGVGVGVTLGRGVGVGVGVGVTLGRGVGVGVGVGVTLGRGVGVGVITGVGVTLGRGVGVGVGVGVTLGRGVGVGVGGGVTGGGTMLTLGRGVGVGVTPPLAVQVSVGVALAPLTWMPKVVLPPPAREPL